MAASSGSDAGRKFRDQKERKIWENLVADLGNEVRKPEDIAKAFIALTTAVGILPTDEKLKQAILNAVRKLKEEATKTNALTEDWHKRFDSIRAQIRAAGNASFAKEEQKEKVEAAKKEAKYKRLKEGERTAQKLVLRQQLAEVTYQLRKKGSDELLSVHKNLTLQLVSLERKDDKKYSEFKKSLKEIEAVDLLDRLETIEDRVLEAKKEAARRWSSIRSAVSSAIVDTTKSVAQSVGIGGVNLYNAYRLGKGTLGLIGGTARLARAGYDSFKLSRDIRSAKQRYAMEYDSDSTNNLADVKSDKEDKQRRDFLGLFSKQVALINKLVGRGDREGSSGLGGLVSGLLSGLGLGKIGGLFGKGKAGAALGGIFRTLAGKGKLIIGAIGGMLLSKIKNAGAFLLGGTKKLAGLVFRFLGRGAIAAIPVVGWILSGILLANDLGLLEGAKKFISPYVSSAIEKVGDFLSNVQTVVVDKLTSLYEGVKTYIDPVVDTVSKAMEWVTDKFQKVYNFVADIMDGQLGNLKDLPLIGPVIGSIERGTFKKDAIDFGKRSYSRITTEAVALGQGISSVAGSIWSGATDTAASVADYTNSVYSGLPGAYDSISNTLTNLFSTQGRVDMQNLDPRMRAAFLAAVEEYKMRGGKHRVVVTSGYRSPEQQAALHAKDPSIAAPPGRSVHNLGLGIDADRSALNEMESMGILAKYGLSRPIKSEPWHLQPAGLSIKASKAGIYSADSPKDQGLATTSPSIRTQQLSTEAPSISIPKETAKPISDTSGNSSKTSPKEGVSLKRNIGDFRQFSYSDSGFMALNMNAIAV
jgi:hypothetical protein